MGVEVEPADVLLRQREMESGGDGELRLPHASDHRRISRRLAKRVHLHRAEDPPVFHQFHVHGPGGVAPPKFLHIVRRQDHLIRHDRDRGGFRECAHPLPVIDGDRLLEESDPFVAGVTRKGQRIAPGIPLVPVDSTPPNVRAKPWSVFKTEWTFSRVTSVGTATPCPVRFPECTPRKMASEIADELRAIVNVSFLWRVTGRNSIKSIRMTSSEWASTI